MPGVRTGRAAALRELAGVFLKLGTIGFGGPAAHIAMMEDEVVARRRWLSREHFLDLLGVTNFIPGPNSTEMAIHLGFLRAGWGGLVVAGASFILPAVLITGAFAWLYMKLGTVPAAAPFLAGIKPVVLAVILGAVWRLGKTALADRPRWLIGLAALAASLAGVNEVAVLLAGGLAGALLLRGMRRAPHAAPGGSLPALLLGVAPWKSSSAMLAVGGAAAAVQLSRQND